VGTSDTHDLVIGTTGLCRRRDYACSVSTSCLGSPVKHSRSPSVSAWRNLKHEARQHTSWMYLVAIGDMTMESSSQIHKTTTVRIALSPERNWRDQGSGGASQVLTSTSRASSSSPSLVIPDVRAQVGHPILMLREDWTYGDTILHRFLQQDREYAQLLTLLISDIVNVFVISLNLSLRARKRGVVRGQRL
jgi:hypothetical protein